MIGLALVSAINVLSSSAKASIDKARRQDVRRRLHGHAGLARVQPGASRPRPYARVPGVEQVTEAYQRRVQGRGGPADVRVAHRRRPTSVTCGEAQARVGLARTSAATACCSTSRPRRRRSCGRARRARRGSPDGGSETLRVAGVYAKNQLLSGRVLALPALRAHSAPPGRDWA